MPTDLWSATRYVVRGRVLGLFGRLRVETADGTLVASGIVRSHWSTFSVTVVDARPPEREEFVIQARPKSSLSDVVDAGSGERIGALRRRYWVPLTRDEWTVFDARDEEIGLLREERAWLNRLGVGRRLFIGEAEGRPACTLRERWGLFAPDFEVDCSDDFSGAMDRRLVIAVALLLCMLGQQE
jgi:hypothetical protein